MKRCLGLFLSLAFLSPPAFAALTDSEKAVVRTFIVKGAADTAPRVRALVARPDLTADEVALALKPGLAETTFDEKHQRFLDALLFGMGSAATRSTLVPAVVNGLLARASAIFDAVPLEPTARVDAHGRRASEESLELHAYVDRQIANSGSPPADGHDPGANIRDDALKAAALLYKDHLAVHAQAFGAGQRVSPEMFRLRVQVGLTLVDLARGIVGREELAEWLGLTGERRAVFERAGVLVDADGAPDARVAAALGMLESAKATDGLSAWFVTKVSPAGLSARGTVARAGVVLGDALRPIDGATLWPAEVKPSAPDAALVGVARSVAELAVARAFARTPSLRERAGAAVERASRAGASGYLAPGVGNVSLPLALGRPAPGPSPEIVLGGAIELLLLDGARTVELALIRSGEGRPEPLEQLALALTVLGGDGGDRIVLGATRDDGRVEPIAATEVKSGEGLVNAFVLSGKKYNVIADKEGVFTGRVDGAVARLTALPDFRERPVAGSSFRAEGVDYDRLFGEPRAVGLDDGRLVLEGSRAGFDALATGPEGSEQEVAAVIVPKGSGGGLILRGRAGEGSYEGVGVLLEVDANRVRLLRFDGHAKAIQLADPVPLPKMPPKGYLVSLKVDEDRVTAKIDGRVIAGKLVGEVGPGRAGIAVRADGRLDVLHLVARTKAAK